MASQKPVASRLRRMAVERAQQAPPMDRIPQADLSIAMGVDTPVEPTFAEIRRHNLLLLHLRQWFTQIMDEHRLDGVIYPTVRMAPQPRRWGFTWHNTSLASLLGAPAISVPAGFVNRLPVGLDIMGKPGRDAEVLGLAYAYEQATHHRQLPGSTPALKS